MTSVSGAGPVVVTPSVMSQQMISNLTADQSAIAALQGEISSGQSILTPSDNPSAAAESLQLQAGLTRAQQYATNAQNGLSWLSLGNSTLNSVLSALQTVRSTVLGLSGTNLSGGSTAVAAAAQQVSSIRAELVNLGNTQFAGQALFSGTGNVQQAYLPDGTYVGAGSAPTVTVAPGTQVAISVTGPAVFGTGSTGLLGNAAGNVGVLAQIVQDLQTGTPASLQAAQTVDLGNLDTAISRVESQAGTLGSNQQALQSLSGQATATVTSIQEQLSSLQDVNMAQAITNLQLQQTAYQAALYATSQLHTASLVQYL